MMVAMTRLKDLGVGDRELSGGKGFELGKVKQLSSVLKLLVELTGIIV